MSDVDKAGRGARDAAAVLPFVAIVLLAPPLVLIFAAPVTVVGIPLMVAYLFGVWLVVIVTAFLLSRRLREAEQDHGQDIRPPDSGRR